MKSKVILLFVMAWFMLFVVGAALAQNDPYGGDGGGGGGGNNPGPSSSRPPTASASETVAPTVIETTPPPTTPAPSGTSEPTILPTGIDIPPDEPNEPDEVLGNRPSAPRLPPAKGRGPSTSGLAALPFTGADLLLFLALGSVTVGAGTVLLRRAPRRRDSSEDGLG